MKAREIEGLDCARDAVFNIDLILRTRLAEMCALREKALDFSDVEGVHDMRVASRRLRSTLRDFIPYLNERKAPRKQLKEMARSLGGVRDEDVAIAALEKLLGAADETASAGIEALVEERRRRQAAAREHLQLAISEEAINELQERFDAWLRSAATARAKGDAARDLSFMEMAREVISSQHREVEELSSSLFSPFDVEPLHDMRIAAKRLRYSLELFSPCFGGELKKFAKEIAELQTSLGDLHDCDVWIDDLGLRLNARADGARDFSAEEEADLWLLQHFVGERTRHYFDALSRWSEWQRTGFYAKLHEKLHESLSHQSIEG